MTRLTLILMIFLASCGTKLDPHNDPVAQNTSQRVPQCTVTNAGRFGCYIPSQNTEKYKIIEDIRNGFDREFGIGGSLVVTVVNHGDMRNFDDSFIGYCDGVKIIVDEKTLDEQLKSLVYHEMGHCVLKLPHNNAVDRHGVPQSIMYPNVPIFTKQNEARYIAELHSEVRGLSF